MSELVPVLKAICPPTAFSGGGAPSRMLPTYQAAMGVEQPTQP